MPALPAPSEVLAAAFSIPAKWHGSQVFHSLRNRNFLNCSPVFFPACTTGRVQTCHGIEQNSWFSSEGAPGEGSFIDAGCWQSWHHGGWSCWVGWNPLTGVQVPSWVKWGPCEKIGLASPTSLNSRLCARYFYFLFAPCELKQRAVLLGLCFPVEKITLGTF